MRAALRIFLPWLVALAFVALGVWYVSRHWDELAGIGRVSSADAAALVVLIGPWLYLTGLQNKLVLRPLGVALKEPEHFALFILTTLGNYFLPMRGGMALRAVYLKTRHGLPFSEFVVALSGAGVIQFAVIGLNGMASLLHLRAAHGQFSAVMFGLFAALTAAMGLIFAIPHDGLCRLARALRLRPLIAMTDGWARLKRAPRAVALSALVFAACSWSYALLFHVALRALGLGMDFGGALYISSAALAAVLTGVTPAALGVVEAAAMFAAQCLGVAPAHVLLVALLTRAATILFGAAAFLPSWLYLQREIRRGASAVSLAGLFRRAAREPS